MPIWLSLEAELSYLTIWLIALDVHIDLLVQPVPLFPTFAAYGTGILCRLGVPLPLRGSLFGLLSVNQIWIAWHCIVVRNECSNMHSSMCVPSPSDHTKSKFARYLVVDDGGDGVVDGGVDLDGGDGDLSSDDLGGNDGGGDG
uniref:G protein-coupled receptor n=1 Tax=Pristionchus pacificus TaxID=54126 RepID=A0A2A6CLT6_PRIPA